MDQALAAGTDVVLRIDVQGAATVKSLMPEAITVFVAAESQAKLVDRLVSRKTETMVGCLWWVVDLIVQSVDLFQNLVQSVDQGIQSVELSFKSQSNTYKYKRYSCCKIVLFTLVYHK